MFRRRTSQEVPGFDAGTGINVASEPAPGPKQQQDAQQHAHDAVAAFSQDRRISGDRLAGSTKNPSVPVQRTVSRARVQQAPGSPVTPLQLAPLQQLKPSSLLTQPGAVQGFSLFSNPLSSPNKPTLQAAAAPAAARQPAALQRHLPATPKVVDGQQQAAHTAAPVSPRQQQLAAEQQQPQQPSQPSSAVATAVDTGSPAAAATSQAVPSDKDAAVTPTGTPLKHSSLLASKALRFEVSAAGGSDGHDQQMLDAEHMQSDDVLQQQYVYNEDTGQLVRVGEGADTTRLARHYLEDWNTGEFFQLAEPSSAWRCFGWFRRKPSTAPINTWGDGANGAQEPSVLRSLADLTDIMGSAMAALGMFAQGLAGGLALLSLFMTYLQYATAGTDGFLGYYSMHAQMVNRAFFTLISLSLVSASSKLAYDKLGSFKPDLLRLRLVDGLVIALYLLAYLCNLILTPTDDQLTYEARRNLTYYMLPLPSAFLRKVTMWHALNLLRIICCGLAWALVCYRANPYVMMLVFEARRQHEAAEAAVGPSIGRSSAGRTQAGAAGVPGDLARQQQQGYINRLLAAEGSNLSNTGIHQHHRLSDSLSNGLAGSAAALGSDGGADYSAFGGSQYNSTGFVGRGGTSRLGAPVGSIPRDGSTHANRLPSVN